MGSSDVRTLPARLDALDDATSRLLHTAGELTDAETAGASLCPGWSRAHILAHLARNAEALERLVRGALTGTAGVMYDTAEQRQSGIDAGVAQSAAILVADLAASSGSLREALALLSEESAQVPVRFGVGGSGAEGPVADVIARRMLEVELHHVDLDHDFTPAHWPADFVAWALDRTATNAADRDDMPAVEIVGNDSQRHWRWGGKGPLVHGPEAALLGWLTGRTSGDGLNCEPPPLPTLPAWG